MHALGSSSVSYEVGVFSPGTRTSTQALGIIPPAVINAVGGSVHVFVDRVHRRPKKGGMPRVVRAGLEKLLVSSGSGGNCGNGAGQREPEREIDYKKATDSGLEEVKARI